MEKTCTFFGHGDAPGEVAFSLRAAIRTLIVNEGVKTFYVGTHGAFDIAARNALRELKVFYPKMRYHVVLSYIPTEKGQDELEVENTLVPEGIESVPKRFAIV